MTPSGPLHPERSKMPPTCAIDTHTWAPLNVVIDPRMGIPTPGGARVYLVCVVCWQHTYVVSEFVGSYHDKPPPLVPAFEATPIPHFEALVRAVREGVKTCTEWGRIVDALDVYDQALARFEAVHVVRFGKKSEWQKDDCISGDDCANRGQPSTLEARYRSSAVRCCEAPKCMGTATRIVLAAAAAEED